MDHDQPIRGLDRVTFTNQRPVQGSCQCVSDGDGLIDPFNQSKGWTVTRIPGQGHTPHGLTLSDRSFKTQTLSLCFSVTLSNSVAAAGLSTGRGCETNK